MFWWVKCFLYTSSTDDLLCYPAVALAGGNVLPLTAMARATFKLKAKAEQQLLMKDVGIKYDRFLAVDNNVAFKACGEFLCTRTRRSNDAGREITTSVKSIQSYNTAMVNDIKRSTVRRASSKLRLGLTLSHWTCTTCCASASRRKTTRSWSNST